MVHECGTVNVEVVTPLSHCVLDSCGSILPTLPGCARVCQMCLVPRQSSNALTAKADANKARVLSGISLGAVWEQSVYGGSQAETFGVRWRCLH